MGPDPEDARSRSDAVMLVGGHATGELRNFKRAFADRYLLL